MTQGTKEYISFLEKKVEALQNALNTVQATLRGVTENTVDFTSLDLSISQSHKYAKNYNLFGYMYTLAYKVFGIDRVSGSPSNGGQHTLCLHRVSNSELRLFLLMLKEHDEGLAYAIQRYLETDKRPPHFWEFLRREENGGQ